MSTICERLLDVIKDTPGLTELELAEALFGLGTPQQRVNGDCRYLIQLGYVERRGRGGNGDPFRYYLKPKTNA